MNATFFGWFLPGHDLSDGVRGGSARGRGRRTVPERVEGHLPRTVDPEAVEDTVADAAGDAAEGLAEAENTRCEVGGDIA
jgi:hypothetical protein